MVLSYNPCSYHVLNCAGAIAAYLLGIPFGEAMLSILLGVMTAGVIMTVVSKLGWIGAAIAGVAIASVAGGVLMKSIKGSNAKET